MLATRGRDVLDQRLRRDELEHTLKSGPFRRYPWTRNLLDTRYVTGIWNNLGNSEYFAFLGDPADARRHCQAGLLGE
jgi:hypothetical protein